MTSVEDRLGALRGRTAAFGVAPAPVLTGPTGPSSSSGDGWTTLALGLDAYRAAAEDEWPDEVVTAVADLAGSSGSGALDPRSLSSLLPLGQDQLRGHVSQVKGRVFENQVASGADQLPLPDGADGIRLADSVTQPGWDGELTADGDVVGFVQMKAAQSLEAVTHHLDRYPDVDAVVVTSNLAEAAAAAGVPVIDSGVDLADLTAQVGEALESLDLSSAVMEFLPTGALSVLVLRGAMKVREGESLASVGQWLVDEAGPVVALQTLGLVAELATGAIGVRVAVTTGGRLVQQRRRVALGAGARIDACDQRLRAVAARGGCGVPASAPHTG